MMRSLVLIDFLEVADLLPKDVDEENKWLNLAEVGVRSHDRWPEPRVVIPVAASLPNFEPCIRRVHEQYHLNCARLERDFGSHLLLETTAFESLPKTPGVKCTVDAEHHGRDARQNVTNHEQGIIRHERGDVLDQVHEQTDPLSHEADEEDNDVNGASTMVTCLLTLFVFNDLAEMHHVVDGDTDSDIGEDARHGREYCHLVVGVVVEGISEVDNARQNPERHEDENSVKGS